MTELAAVGMSDVIEPDITAQDAERLQSLTTTENSKWGAENTLP